MAEVDSLSRSFMNSGKKSVTARGFNLLSACEIPCIAVCGGSDVGATGSAWLAADL